MVYNLYWWIKQKTDHRSYSTCTLHTPHTSNCCIAYSPRFESAYPYRYRYRYRLCRCQVGWFTWLARLSSAMLCLGCLWLAPELGGLACFFYSSLSKRSGGGSYELWMSGGTTSRDSSSRQAQDHANSGQVRQYIGIPDDKNSIYKRNTVISSPIIHPPFPMFPVFYSPSSPYQIFTLWLNPPKPPSSLPPTLLIPPP